jgi:transcription termination/antitermination protein NusG
VSLRPGDRVRVTDGPYTGWEGEVLRVEPETQRAVVVVPAFGRQTAIDLPPSQIAPIR